MNALKATVVIFVVYCSVLQAVSGAEAEIEFQLTIHPEKGLIIISRNGFRKNQNNFPTFTLIEGKPAKISVYYNHGTLDKEQVEKIQVKIPNIESSLSVREIESDHNKYSVMTENVTLGMERYLKCVFILKNTKIPYIKFYFRVHVRPADVKNLPYLTMARSPMRNRNTTVLMQNSQDFTPTKIWDSSIKIQSLQGKPLYLDNPILMQISPDLKQTRVWDSPIKIQISQNSLFDGFGCLSYMGEIRELNFVCLSRNGAKIVMLLGGLAYSQNKPTPICKENYCNAIVDISINGSYIDCKEITSEDYEVVRLFFIKSPILTPVMDYQKSITNYSQYECLEYVNERYRIPNQIKPSQHLLTTAAPQHEEDPNKHIKSVKNETNETDTHKYDQTNTTKQTDAATAFTSITNLPRYVGKDSKEPPYVTMTNLAMVNTTQKPKATVLMPKTTQLARVITSTERYLERYTTEQSFLKNGDKTWPIIAGVAVVLLLILILFLIIKKILNLLRIKNTSTNFITDTKNDENNQNIYINSDLSTVRYSKDLADLYAVPIPKQKRMEEAALKQAKESVIIENPTYNSNDICIEPNYAEIIRKDYREDRSGETVNDSLYSYAYVNRFAELSYDEPHISGKGYTATEKEADASEHYSQMIDKYVNIGNIKNNEGNDYVNNKFINEHNSLSNNYINVNNPRCNTGDRNQNIK